MSVDFTFEDRLRAALGVSRSHDTEYGATCAVYQRDLADALSLITALRGANREQAEVIAALAKPAAEPEGRS